MYGLRKYYEQAPIGKGESIESVKDRKRLAEEAQQRKVKKKVRARDGFCRLSEVNKWFGLCGGISEWAHLNDKKRARTRGQAPEVRHTSAGSLQLCSTHHQAHDAGKLPIEPKTKDGADGVLLVGPEKVEV